MINSYPEATEEDIVQALKRAHAWEFVEKLDEGIDHPVGAVGSKLSGGQKQRIAIARALVRNPQILIFDESTSALDIESEKKVQKAIDSIEGESITKVVIAHRLTTVKNADDIIVLDRGQIVEQGNHDQLLQVNKIYANMAKVQGEANRTKEAIALKEGRLSETTVGETTGQNLSNAAQQETTSEKVRLLDSDDESQLSETSQQESENQSGLLFVLKEVLAFASPK